jgi:integrase-like protein
MHCDYKTRDQARASLFDYMEVFYNRQRRHSTINYVAPLAFEESTVVSTMFRTFVGGSLIRSQAAASSGSGLSSVSIAR